MGVSTDTHPTQPMNITSEPFNIVDMAEHEQEQILTELASSNSEKADNLMRELIELVKMKPDNNRNLRRM